MVFNITYGYLQEKNINHLYTTREKTMHKNIPKQRLYRPEFLQLEMEANDRFKKRRERKREPNMEFVPEFNIEVPRAPAFRVADKTYVDELVARLTQKPELKSNPRGCGHYRRVFTEYERGLQEIDSPRDQPRSRRSMREILNRLTKPGGCGRRHPSPALQEDDDFPNFVI